MKTHLTSEELKELGACKEARYSFRAIFGKKATIKEVIHRLQNPGKRDLYAYEYEEWLADLLREDVELIPIFIEAGLDIHINNDFPFRYAVYKGKTEIVKLLIELGADTQNHGDWAFLSAVKHNYIGILKLLLEKGICPARTKTSRYMYFAQDLGYIEIAKLIEEAIKKFYGYTEITKL